MADYTRWLNTSHNARDDEIFAGLYAELRRIGGGSAGVRGAPPGSGLVFGVQAE